jgi:hypothetical protein
VRAGRREPSAESREPSVERTADCEDYTDSVQSRDRAIRHPGTQEEPECRSARVSECPREAQARMEKRMRDNSGTWAVPKDVRERVRQLLCDLVAIPSYGGQEDAIIRYLTERFARQGITCSDALGRPIRAAGFSATCDMTFLVNSAGIRTVILGPGDIQVAHQANEHISIEQMALGVEVYMKTIEGWMKDESTQPALFAKTVCE